MNLANAKYLAPSVRILATGILGYTALNSTAFLRAGLMAGQMCIIRRNVGRFCFELILKKSLLKKQDHHNADED